MYEQKHSLTNLNVQGGYNQRIADLEALKLERETIRKFSEEKRHALNMIILNGVLTAFFIIPVFFIPKWIRRYHEADEFLKRAKNL